MLPPGPPKISQRDFDPASASHVDEDAEMHSEPDVASVELSSVEINILIYLYLLESNFVHTAFTLLAESNLPSTTLFQHFNPSYPTSSTSIKPPRLNNRQKDKDTSPTAPNFGRANGKIERGELIRKLWKAVRWEQVERHVGPNGEPATVQCPNPFHLLIPHVCPPSFPSATFNPPLPLPPTLQPSTAAAPPPPKRPEVFPPPEDQEEKQSEKEQWKEDGKKGKKKAKRLSSSPPSTRDRSPSPSIKSKPPSLNNMVKEKTYKRARLTDNDEEDMKSQKKEPREASKDIHFKPSANPSRSTTPGDASRRPSPKPKGDKPQSKKGTSMARDEVDIWVEHRDVVSNVAWNPKNVDLLATGSSDGFVRLWEFSQNSSSQNSSLTLPNRPSGISHKGIESNKKTITAVAWHPDGTILATGSQDGVGRLFTPSGQLQAIMSYGRGAVNAMKWSPSGTAILVGKDDFTVCKWMDRGGSMAMKMCFDAHTKEVNDVDWLDDDVFASAGNDHTIFVHYSDDKRPRFTFKGHIDDVTAIKWSPAIPGKTVTSRLLASVSDDGNCMIWKLPYYPSSRGASSAPIGPTGRSISPVKRQDPPSDEDDYFQSSTPVTGADNCLHKLSVVSGSENKRMSMLEWMPSGNRMILAAGGQDSTVKLFDALTGETLHILTGLESGTGSLSFSPPAFSSLPVALGIDIGKLGLLAGGGWDGVIQIWDVESGRILWSFEVEEDEAKRTMRERPMLLDISWRADGRHLACGLHNKSMMVVNVVKALDGERHSREQKE
nr:hypothetical protein L203_03650 [Cryptococcus depauperatus CBS 7841]